MHLINLINVQNLSLYPKKERKKESQLLSWLSLSWSPNLDPIIPRRNI